MPNIKYCRSGCKWGSDRMRRIYIRENTPITGGYKRKFEAIGWICKTCGGIVLDNQEKYVSFNVYHKLEFDYNQLLKNYEKYCMEEK